MNLNNAYRIILSDDKGIPYIQYIEADSLDEAIAKAKNTFSARLYNLGQRYKGSEGQKACNKSKLRGRLLFSFAGGHITLQCLGSTIFEMLEVARAHDFVEGREITEITSSLFYRSEYDDRGVPKWCNRQAQRQGVIEGAEEISQSELIERKMKEAKRSAKEQLDPDFGLFDSGRQPELFGG